MKKLKREKTWKLTKERDSLVNELKNIRTQMMSYEIAIRSAKEIAKLDEAAANNQVSKELLKENMEELKSLEVVYNNKLKQLSEVENILKTRSDKKGNVLKIGGLLGLGALSVGLTFHRNNNNEYYDKDCSSWTSKIMGFLSK